MILLNRKIIQKIHIISYYIDNSFNIKNIELIKNIFYKI